MAAADDRPRMQVLSTAPQPPLVQGAVKPKGVELKPGEKVVCEVVLMHLLNRFEELDPTHFREARCGLKITWKGVRAECMLIALSRPDPYLGGLLWKWGMWEEYVGVNRGPATEDLRLACHAQHGAHSP